MTDVVDSLQYGRAEAADAVWRDGAELCVRLVSRTSRNKLRHAGISTPVALYDDLKRVFLNADESITLGYDLSVGLGKVDRHRQLHAFAE